MAWGLAVTTIALREVTPEGTPAMTRDRGWPDSGLFPASFGSAAAGETKETKTSKSAKKPEAATAGEILGHVTRSALKSFSRMAFFSESRKGNLRALKAA